MCPHTRVYSDVCRDQSIYLLCFSAVLINFTYYARVKDFRTVILTVKYVVTVKTDICINSLAA